MIDHLDSVLRHLFMSRVTHLRPKPEDPPVTPNNVLEEQVRFQPPDGDWRTHVSGLGTRKALNVYLVDLRENRKLRSNERARSTENGVVSETPAPNRMDCHYLITAWSPATEGAGRTEDEHQLLHEVTAVLMKSQPLVPSEAFAPEPLPATFPEVIAQAELPTTVLPVEGFPKYAEFWGTMGTNHRWKPAVWLVVTLPVVMDAQVAGPMVTTRIAEFRQGGSPETAETWIQIGGHVFNSAVDPPAPLAGAWVRLQTLQDEPLQITQTKESGRFTFNGLRAGSFRLRYQAIGFGENFRDVEVPSPTGEYDLQF